VAPLIGLAIAMMAPSLGRRVTRVWTSEQAASLAPDASALKAAQGLASPRKWPSLGRDDDFAWGLAQGSGKEPYQVVVELAGPAFKCSCPSRKFPCKHGLGLLLLWAGQPGAVAASDRPPWVAEWAARRNERATKHEARVAEKVAAVAATGEKAAPADLEAQARRREKREANILKGIAQLDGWLRDLVRQGFAAVAANAASGYAFWDEPARRLVDAQAPGLARRVRELGDAVGNAAPSGEYEARIAAALARLRLLCAAYPRRTDLDAGWQAELEEQIGWTTDQDILLAQAKDAVRDVWFAAAQTRAEAEGIITRVTFLVGEKSRRTARVFEFAQAARPVFNTLAPGHCMEAELVFFPGADPERALVKGPPAAAANAAAAIDLGTFDALTRCADVLHAHSARVAKNPLAENTLVLARLIPQPSAPVSASVSASAPAPAHDGAPWFLRDDAGDTLPLAKRFPGVGAWDLRACSGGRPILVAGLWDGFELMPHGAFDAGSGRWIIFGAGKEAGA
jgi:hypothetical protein